MSKRDACPLPKPNQMVPLENADLRCCWLRLLLLAHEGDTGYNHPWQDGIAERVSLSSQRLYLGMYRVIERTNTSDRGRYAKAPLAVPGEQQFCTSKSLGCPST